MKWIQSTRKEWLEILLNQPFCKPQAVFYNNYDYVVSNQFVLAVKCIWKVLVWKICVLTNVMKKAPFPCNSKPLHNIRGCACISLFSIAALFKNFLIHVKAATPHSMTIFLDSYPSLHFGFAYFGYPLVILVWQRPQTTMVAINLMKATYSHLLMLAGWILTGNIALIQMSLQQNKEREAKIQLLNTRLLSLNQASFENLKILNIACHQSQCRPGHYQCTTPTFYSKVSIIISNFGPQWGWPFLFLHTASCFWSIISLTSSQRQGSSPQAAKTHQNYMYPYFNQSGNHDHVDLHTGLCYSSLWKSPK